jgi:hypothetical protein
VARLIDAPISGVATAHLRAKFTAGSAAGEYVVTLKLNGGNSAQMFVRVE